MSRDGAACACSHKPHEGQCPVRLCGCLTYRPRKERGSLTFGRGVEPQPLHKKSTGSAPIAPQASRGRVTAMSFDEAKVRLEAARGHLKHAIDGDIDPLDGIHFARRLLAEAERLLRHDAA